jgi:HK97 family phage prohead protease
MFHDMANASQTVTRSEALSVPAVLKGRNLLCSVATLPLVQYGPDYTRYPLPLLTQIDPSVANVVTLSQTVEDLVFEARSLWRVTAFDADGYPAGARHVDTSAWRLSPPSAQPYAPLPSGDNPRNSVPWVDGEELDWGQVILFESPNPGLLTGCGRRAIRRAILLDKAAGVYADGGKPLDYFSPADGAEDVDDDEVLDILAKWKAARKEGSTAWVPRSMQYNPVDSPSPADLQLVELQKQAMLEIANLIGLDPEDVGVSTTSRTYFNAQDRRQSRINDVLAPYMRAITDRLSMADITKDGYRVEFDLDDYLKADSATRWSNYTAANGMGAMTVDEIREEERRPPLTLKQRNELKPPPPPPAMLPPIQVPSTQGAVQPPNKALAASFSGDQPFVVFDPSDVAASFSVDMKRRTITGMTVPWGKVGQSGGQKWKFGQDSLRYNRSLVNQMEFLEDHDPTQVLGRLNRTWSDGQGQWSEYKVDKGPAGDRALARAARGEKTGLSVGINFEDGNYSFTFAPDPEDPDVRFVTVAPWKETSLVANPAFDGARVSAVTMSADERNPMNCPTCGAALTPGVAHVCPTTPPVAQSFTAEQVAAMFSALTPAVQPVTAPAAPEPRPVVVPPQASAAVNEGPMYRFDGNKGQRCFTADIASGFDGDSAVRAKAEKFMADTMAAAFANVSVANVTTLNPSIQRPDLYVPNLYFSRPLGALATGGVVNEITRQTLPKFSSSSGLAQLHAEGVEPTEGAFATTSQNVDPKAIDGLLKINREVIDQGGTPQSDQIMWNEMTQFYAKLLETRLVDALQALSLSDTPVVGTDADLQAALLSLIAGLQFIAGGDRYRALGLNQDLYTAIVGAVDNDGRSLFPMLNPTNASGSTSADFSNVRVGSKVGVPSWALASGNGGPDKSFLFVPESVYQWFSPPRRIDLNQVAVSYVGIGIWGYSAEFVTRNADVLQLAYTAS